MKIFFILLLIIQAPAFTESRGADFQNLGFEHPTFVPVSGTYLGSMDSVAALPGWTTYWGSNLAPFVLYDNYFLDSRGISIFDASLSWPSVPLQGRYSVLLQGGFTLAGPGARDSASIAQVGVIPLWANSLTFKILLPGESYPQYFGVSVADQPASVIIQNSTGMVDISPFSGQEVEIKFTAYPRPYPGLAINNIVIDAIAFSPEVVPEPRTEALIALALLLFRVCRRQPPEADHAERR
jgi:hypothetical protein